MPEIKPGIYLEIKKGVIGTGHTAKSAEYRNFWMTVGLGSHEVEMILLDQNFKPTNIREKRPISDFETKRLVYIPEGDKKYQNLSAQIEPTVQPSSSQTGAGPVQAEAPPVKAKWWEAPEKKITPGDIFKREEKARSDQDAEATGSGNWWEAKKPAGGPGREKNQPPAPPKPAGAKKQPTEKSLKKNWWDS
ncbi:MAG: hypothetical protein AB1641_16820 [Thermodesulfobacteriota bacterium]